MLLSLYLLINQSICLYVGASITSSRTKTRHNKSLRMSLFYIIKSKNYRKFYVLRYFFFFQRMDLVYSSEHLIIFRGLK
jgi:hypothetical protein